MACLLYNQKPLIADLIVADTFWKRGIGLMGRPGLEQGRGLFLRPCGALHTCFMRFPIDVIFLDASNRVVRTKQNVKPWRMVWGGRKAHSVIEVQSGWLKPFPAIGEKVGTEGTLLTVSELSRGPHG